MAIKLMVHREGWTIPDMQNNSPLEDSELEPEVSYLSLKVTIYSLVVFFLLELQVDVMCPQK